MELVLAILIVLILGAIFGIGFLVGGRQVINRVKKDGGYFDTEITGSIYPYKTSSANDEVPVELLLGGDIDRALHIAGIKEASPELKQKWADERNKNIEEKQVVDDTKLMKYLEEQNEQLLIKAGLKAYDTNKGASDLAKIMSALKDAPSITLADMATPKGYDPLKEEAKRKERAKKETDKWIEQKTKMDFEALPMSRISNDARKQITELVRLDIENQMKEIEKNTPPVITSTDGKIDLTKDLKPKRKYTKRKTK